ncbi:MAG: phytanoyl-CoA dioxygenase family protein [Candidatus Sungiibacteriota bacterium]|uniref:Phytanoyl-CoA dioxygenase family protein n=1 Tax=Candidatus Sungiibacteriota bacterium TaxID=2750080 RepID=A0A7T5RJS8_9BACT|nr:MAG: phytanoyl-CoA dioxygenase family protein [Candidatus Sungbacteria bacterium]
MDICGCGLTSVQVQLYKENGYLVVPDVFVPAECGAVLRVYERYAKPDFRGIMNLERGFVEYQEQDADGNEKVERREVLADDSLAVWSMISDHRLVKILGILQLAEVVHLQSMVLFKRAGTSYALQAWNPHQDNAYPQADYGMYITGNIALEDHTVENGGMYIYPGSHKEPILPSVKVKSFHEKSGKSPGHCVEVPSRYQAVDLEFKKGSVLFLHGNVIHGSRSNESERSRAMLLVPYGTLGISKGKNFVPGRIAQRKEACLACGHESWKKAVRCRRFT